jgi:Escherichia/Staphylococcus phage prohead protease
MLAPNEEHVRLFRPRATIDADGTVEGYASLFGEVDQARDMVMPGAFTETLKLRGLRRVPMLFQHDPAEPVGIWLELREDQRGLYARGRLIPEVARGRELLALLRERAIDGLSIGFRTASARVDPKSRIRKIYHVDLWEISIVTFPLLAGARVQAVKDLRFSRPFPPPHSASKTRVNALVLGEGRVGTLRTHQGEDERLLRKYPRVSFARKTAEQAWQRVAKGAGAAPAVAAQPSNERQASRPHKRGGRGRIRGWLSDSALRERAGVRRLFAQPAR